MTDAQAFALGFLDECAERGFPPALLFGEKSASIGQLIGNLTDIGVLGGVGLVGAPLGVGMLAGRALGSMGDVAPEDISEAQAAELASYYEQQADRMKRLKAQREFHEATRRVGRRFV